MNTKCGSSEKMVNNQAIMAYYGNLDDIVSEMRKKSLFF